MKEYIRKDLQNFGGYISARSDSPMGTVWLNANEAASANDVAPGAWRYPSPQSPELVAALGEYYAVSPTKILVGRGSDEAIDVIIRATCNARRDGVLVMSPTFGMYAVSARIHGAVVHDVPLIDTGTSWEVDWTEVRKTALAQSIKAVFVCAPGNPTGHQVDPADIAELATALRGRALVVVDEAYAEFSPQASAISLLNTHENIVILRTLSKAFALAGARVGALIAHPELVAIFRACQAPYPLPESSIQIARNAFTPAALQNTRALVSATIEERSRVRIRLTSIPNAKAVYESAGNFVLVRWFDASLAISSLLQRGIVVRDQRSAPQLHDALRISIGTTDENNDLLTCLEEA